MKKSLLHFLFIVFISSAYAQSPTNDDCANAIELTNLKDWCSDKNEYTNIGSSGSIKGNPSCWKNTNGVSETANNDVWFKFRATGDAINLSIKGNGTGGGSLKRPQIVLYSGDCDLGSLLEIACANYSGDASSNSYSSLYTSGLTIGKEYLVAVDGSGSSTGTFQVCVNNFNSPKIPGQDCDKASSLCNKNSITVKSLKGFGIEETAGTCLDAPGLGPTDNNVVWYKFTAATTGTLEFVITPNIPSNDVDWILYELRSDNCNTKTNVKCNGEQDTDNSNTGLPEGATGIKDFNSYPGMQWERAITITQGKTYGLMVNNWTDYVEGTDNGFTLSFGGTTTFVGPKADFSTSVSTACTNDTITVSNSSIGSPTNYEWDFGDDAVLISDTVVNPAGPHKISYKKGGSKTIVLKIGNGKCDDVFFKTINVGEGETPAITGSTSICGGTTTTLTASTSTPANFKWYDAATNGNLFFTGNSYTTSILNADTTFYLESANGSCSGTARTPVNIKVTSVNKPISSNPNPVYCASEKRKISDLSPNGSNIIWYDAASNGTVLSNETVLSTGNYFAAEKENSSNCESVERSLVNVTVNDTLPPSVTDNVQKFCSATKVSGLIPFGQNIFWYDSLTGGNLLSDQTDLTNGKTYFVGQKSNENGCESSIRIPVTVNIDSAATIIFSANTKSSICYGDTAKIEVENPVAGTTYNIFSSFDDANPIGTATYAFIPKNDTIYYLEAITASGCKQANPRIPILIRVNPNPDKPQVLASSQTICLNNPLVLKATSSQPNITYNWTGPNNFKSNEQNPLVTAAPDSTFTGKYYVSITDKTTGCKSEKSDSIDVIINTLKAAFNASITSGFTSSKIDFTNTSINSTKYFWNFQDGSSTDEKNPSHNYSKAGNYKVYLVAVNGSCSDTAYGSDINIEETSFIEIPNVFTPNNDNINDVFSLKSRGIKTLDCKIFNRWGELIYEMINVKDTWSGFSLSGLEASDGIYFYIINANGFDGKIYKHQGSLMLAK